MRKMVALLVASAAVAASSAPAEAAQWYSHGKPIPTGVVEPVASKGTLALTLRSYTGVPESSTACKVSDEERIENGPGGGTGEITSLTFSHCRFRPSPCPAGSSPGLRSEQLPWLTSLSSGAPITERFGASVGVTCGGSLLTWFEDVLEPEVGASVLDFSLASGTLSGPDYWVTVVGADKLKGPKADKKITAG